MKLIPMNLIEEKKIARISKKEMKSIQRYLSNIGIILQNLFHFKTRCKKVSVFIFLGVLIAVVLAHCISIAVMVNRGFDMNTLVAFISASVSLITALLVIPTKIIEFIFNRDEEKYFVEIIRNIQDYDKKVRDDFKALAS